jgi:hypothetical protein
LPGSTLFQRGGYLISLLKLPQSLTRALISRIDLQHPSEALAALVLRSGNRSQPKPGQFVAGIACDYAAEYLAGFDSVAAAGGFDRCAQQCLQVLV